MTKPLALQLYTLRDQLTGWIVELDRCATDMLETVRDSARNLAGKGYVHGR